MLLRHGCPTFDTLPPPESRDPPNVRQTAPQGRSVLRPLQRPRRAGRARRARAEGPHGQVRFPEEREQHARLVDDAEHAADRITAETIRLLHKTFITPLDRDHIHQLVNAMDDICDLIQDTSESLVALRREGDHARGGAPRRHQREVRRAREGRGGAGGQAGPQVRGDPQDLRGDRPPRVRRRPRDALGRFASSSARRRTCAR